jgi:hypothetical protein
VAINANATGPELDEQKGLANLVKGLFSMYRNPAAHEPRLHRTVTGEELLERALLGRRPRHPRRPALPGGRFLLTLTPKAYAGTGVQAVHPGQ